MLERAVEKEYLKVLPYDGGILLNHVPASLGNVSRNDYRVDLERSGKAAFLVEHILGCLILAGVYNASVMGTSNEYDLTRQTYKDAKEKGLPPSVVLGNPHGTLDATLYLALVEANSKEHDQKRVSVKEEASNSTPNGSIRISPSDHLSIKVVGAGLRYDFEMGDDEKALEIAKAETPYLSGLNERTIPHVVGDVLGDIVGIGGINCADIEMRPGREYHRVTMGVLRNLETVEL